MSLIDTLKGSDVKTVMRKLPEILSEYDELIEDSEINRIISLKGITPEEASKKNPSLYVYYAHKTSELKTLVKYWESQVQAQRGRLFRTFKEKNSLDLNEREIAKFIDGDKRYLDYYEILLEITEVYNKFQDVVDTIRSRGYAIHNIIKARAADVHNTEL